MKEFVEHILAVFLRFANAPFANNLCLQYFYGVCKKLYPALPQYIQTAYPVPYPDVNALATYFKFVYYPFPVWTSRGGS